MPTVPVRKTYTEHTEGTEHTEKRREEERGSSRVDPESE
jgi:hypothetical protein